MSMYIFDIETAPLPIEELERLMPKFEAARNLKDPIKIEADIAAKRQAFIDDAALSAITGRVLAIGVLRMGEIEISHGDNEREIITWFWDIVNQGGGFAGFNTFQFDLPFLIRRSWKLGIDVPPIRDGHRWVGSQVDLRQVWALGEYQAAGSLDMIARHLGLEGKSMDGKLFYQLYRENQEAALDYLRHDLRITAELERRMRA